MYQDYSIMILYEDIIQTSIYTLYTSYLTLDF